METLERRTLARFEEREGTFFMHNGAPCHKSRNYFEGKGIRVLGWPGNSPDLSPIENCWSIMKNKMEQKEKRNLTELEEATLQVWCSEVTPEYCKASARSMPSRCQQAVIKAGGAATKY